MSCQSYIVTKSEVVSFFELYAFILLTSTLVPGINYFVVAILLKKIETIFSRMTNSSTEPRCHREPYECRQMKKRIIHDN